MSTKQFLVRRGNSWSFRRRVPPELRSLIGKREIVKALGTDFQRACERRNLLVVESDRLFSDARAKLSGGLSGLSAHALDAMIAGWREERLRRIRETPHLYDENSDFSPERDRAEAQADLFALRFNPKAAEAQIDAAVTSVLSENGFPVTYPRLGDAVIKSLPSVDVDRTTMEYRYLAERVRTALDDVITAQALLAPGHAPGLAITPPSQDVKPQPDRSLKGVIARFEADPSRRGRDAKRDLDYGMLFAILRELLGPDTDIAAVGRRECERVRALLLRLPPHARKTFPDLSFEAIAEKADADGVERRLTPQTVNSHLTKLSTLFNWCQQQELIARNPALNLKLKGAGHSKADREPYSLDELNLIFGSEHFLEMKPEEQNERYWIPLLGLFQGARANELAQLQLADVREEGDLMGLYIKPGKDKRVKTDASKRLIPVHPTILHLGFPAYVERIRRAGHDRLWPRLRPCAQGRYSTYYCRWFARYLVSRGVKQIGKRRTGDAVHPFRHNWADAAREADIPLHLQEIVGGWTQTTVHSKYGSGPSLRRMSEEIAKIEYPGFILTTQQASQSSHELPAPPSEYD